MFNWFPYTNFHNLNLDWILKKLKDIPTKVSQLENDAGYVTAASAGIITSVNGQTGDVVLDASDVGAVQSVNGQTDVVSLDASDVGAVPTGQGIPTGGAAGEVLVKSSNTDYDVSWSSQSEAITELWVNSDPSSNFGAQTVSLPANSCTEFEIVFQYASNRDFVCGSCKIKPGEKCIYSVAATTNEDAGNFSGALIRGVSSSTQTSIVFKDAHAAEPNNNTVNNVFMIPLRILGYTY